MDRYEGGVDEFSHTDDHWFRYKTIENDDGTETKYIYCAHDECKLGLSLIEKDEDVMSGDEAKEKLNKLSCPPTDEERDSVNIVNGPMLVQKHW